MSSPGRTSRSSDRTKDIETQTGSVRARSRSTNPRRSSSSTRRTSTSPSRTKLPDVQETAIYEAEIKPSPRTPFDFSWRNAASSNDETAYLRRAFLFRQVKLMLAVVLLALGVTALVYETKVISGYNATAGKGREMFLSLWPGNVDVNPTLAVLGVAATVVLLMLVYVVVAIIPSPHSRTATLTHLHLATHSLSFLTTFAVIIYNPVVIHHIFSFLPVANSRPTIQTWTCTLSTSATNFAEDAAKLSLSTTLMGSSGEGLNAPAGFAKLCMESRIGYGVLIGCLVVEVLAIGLGAWNLVVEKGMERLRKERYVQREFGRDEKSEA